jgi:hypothetical protein
MLVIAGLMLWECAGLSLVSHNYRVFTRIPFFAD